MTTNNMPDEIWANDDCNQYWTHKPDISRSATKYVRASRKKSQSLRVKEFTIGDYTISDYADENCFIHHKSGEGGTFQKKALYEIIEKFYQDNF